MLSPFFVGDPDGDYALIYFLAATMFVFNGAAFVDPTTNPALADCKVALSPVAGTTFAGKGLFYASDVQLGSPGDVIQLPWDNATDLPAGPPSYLRVMSNQVVGLIVALAADGLDAISPAPPAGDPSTFREKLMWDLQRRRNSVLTPTQFVTKNDNGDVITQQPVSDNGAAQTMGPPV